MSFVKYTSTYTSRILNCSMSCKYHNILIKLHFLVCNTTIISTKCIHHCRYYTEKKCSNQSAVYTLWPALYNLSPPEYLSTTAEFFLSKLFGFSRTSLDPCNLYEFGSWSSLYCWSLKYILLNRQLACTWTRTVST